MMTSHSSAIEAPEACRRAVQAADDGLFQLKQPVDDALGVIGDTAKQRRIVDHRLEPRHIAAGTKGAAGAGQHDQVAVWIPLQFGKDPRQLFVHLEVDRIHLAGLDCDP